MNILVIGNGFDLAHGLKTTYKDFLIFCNKGTEYDEIINGENEYSKCRYTWTIYQICFCFKIYLNILTKQMIF